MPDLLPRMPSKGPLTPERRQNPRHPVRPTEYIEIGDSNGGIILDISEGGMAVASAQALVGNQTLRFRFQLPRSLETIETSGEINWIGETKKRAGVRFVDLPLAAREQIHKWIDEQTSGHSNGDQKANGSAVGSASPKIPRELPRYEPINRGAIRQESIIPRGQDHEDSTNLKPFSSTLSSPLDEPEVDEAEAEDEEKVSADSTAKPLSEKRAQTRFPMTGSTYVQLSDGNGGLMANLSKTGFCVRAAKTLETDHLPVVRFQLPNARDFVESSAWIVWKSPSKKAAGARFENLSAEAQSQIAQWIDAQPLPKTAPTKNLLSKNPLGAVKSPLEQREKISPSSKISAPVTPVPVTPVPLTLMASDSVPIPAYISPLAISLNAKPAVSSSNSPSAAPPLSKAAPLRSPSKAPAAPTVKPPVPLARVPPMVSAPSSAKPAMSASTPVLPKSQKPVAAAPFVPAIPVAPPIFNEPDWSVAPKRPTGYWKIAAAIVVAAGILFGGATLLRSKKSATPLAQETAQNAAAAATVPATNPSTEAAADSTPTSSAPTNSASTSPSSSASASNAGSSREFRDAQRNTIPAKISPKGDEQFVDEPRPAHSQPQISSTPIQNNAPSSAPASEQPATSRPTPVQGSAERSQNSPGEEGFGFPEVVHRAQAAPAPVSSNANDVANAAPEPASPRSQAASSNQQPNANLATAGGVTQNSSSTPRPAATSENNSSTRTTAPSNNPSQTATGVGAPASSTAAAIPNPVPTVSVFTRFRAIRSGSDAARPAGSDLQIGRLKSGPTPAYPVEALRQQIQGIVELEVLVGADGNILTVHLVKGPPELAGVAMGTVRSWQYGQTTLGGKPVETDQSIYFTFKLTK
jgi:outer membrane biosynthesis protein TonB